MATVAPPYRGSTGEGATAHRELGCLSLRVGPRTLGLGAARTTTRPTTSISTSRKDSSRAWRALPEHAVRLVATSMPDGGGSALPRAAGLDGGMGVTQVLRVVAEEAHEVFRQLVGPLHGNPGSLVSKGWGREASRRSLTVQYPLWRIGPSTQPSNLLRRGCGQGP